ncbi:S-layer homology domain-containing protein [Fortiea sp. LEGE XX443]|uniref:S-layer homology domain-containing protein n=1 Tax=Fortiea sp. LEGE XX443 TaxID=1828611 RepID=UPI00187E86F6|nr:S-layer homology domain-containing protein [Fortiea sp. LEGE XX443]MBE9004585.1 S-layer homology domain-containing protein [Fortiea sp. LEGE XX443]
MTNLPPSDRQSSEETTLGFDEFIAILVAFAAIGGILLWSFSRRDAGWNFNILRSPSPSPTIKTQPSLPSPSPTSQVQPNADSQLDAAPLPPDKIIPEPVPTPGLILPPVPVAPINSQPKPAPFFTTKNLEPSIKSSPLPLVTPAEQKSIIPPPIAFNDVPTNFWAVRFINALSARSIIKGFPDYTFRPNQPINRAEFAAILQKAFDTELSKNSLPFKDVSAQYWATPAIDRAVGTGFLQGYPDKTFQPEQNISRVQVLVALVSGLNLQQPAKASLVLSIYKDAKSIPKYAAGKVAAATANGLVITDANQQFLAPNQEATRAEVAAMVHQALVRLGRLDNISSENIVRRQSPP